MSMYRIQNQKEMPTHERARAHVRAAEKYMYDEETKDTRKAIAHFGRAMHYFGVGGDKMEPTKEQPVFGFIVDSQTSDGKQKEKIAHLHIDDLIIVLVCSTNGTFRVINANEGRYKRTTDADKHGDIGTMVKHYKKGNTGYAVNNRWGKKLRVEHMLVGTDNIGASDALLIRGNEERGHVVLDLGGIVSQPTNGDHADLARFLRGSEQTEYTLRHEMNMSGEDKGTEVSIHSIVLKKNAAEGRMVASLVYVSSANTIKLAETKERLAKSKTPLNEALLIYEGGELRDYGILERDKRIVCEGSEKYPLWCWLQQHAHPDDFVNFTKEIEAKIESEKQAAQQEKKAALKAHAEQSTLAKKELEDNIMNTKDQTLIGLRQELYDTDSKLRKCRHAENLTKIDPKRRVAVLCRDLAVKYIMIVLRKKALIREEAAVECIVKRDFVNTDAGLLLPSKKTEGPKQETPWSWLSKFW